MRLCECVGQHLEQGLQMLPACGLHLLRPPLQATAVAPYHAARPRYESAALPCRVGTGRCRASSARTYPTMPPAVSNRSMNSGTGVPLYVSPRVTLRITPVARSTSSSSPSDTPAWARPAVRAPVPQPPSAVPPATGGRPARRGEARARPPPRGRPPPLRGLDPPCSRHPPPRPQIGGGGGTPPPPRGPDPPCPRR